MEQSYSHLKSLMTLEQPIAFLTLFRSRSTLMWQSGRQFAASLAAMRSTNRNIMTNERAYAVSRRTRTIALLADAQQKQQIQLKMFIDHRIYARKAQQRQNNWKNPATKNVIRKECHTVRVWLDCFYSVVIVP